MSKPGEIRNVVVGDLEDWTVNTLLRPELAARLGVAKERLDMTVVNMPPVGGQRLVAVSVLLDGGDLTEAQTEIFKAFLADNGIVGGITFDEKPVTS